MTITPDGTFTRAGGQSVLRFERTFAHPVAKVWRALTDPQELSQWWPAAVEMDFRPGGIIRFTFPGDVPEVAPDGSRNEVPRDDEDPNLYGRVLEIEHERVFAIDWNGEVLRMELSPDGPGTRLVFTHTFAQPGAAKFAAGWHICLAALEALVAGVPVPQGYDRMQETYDAYAAAFGPDA